MKPFSFIIPSRNNLTYLKMCYNSIRRNAGYTHEICFADDFSEDGTLEWILVQMKRDQNIKLYNNKGPERMGLTILYDKLVREYATNDRLIFFHSDMYLFPEALEEIDKHLKEKVVVSLTRVEPPLHPAGPEKIIKNFGMEPEEFKEQELLDWYNRYDPNPTGYFEETTEGVFAPWAIMRDDFESVGGHDKLFRPQSKEDSDIFNRLYLNGVQFIQTWRGLVYHMTCRGSRFNPYAGGAPGKDSPEWIQTTTKNMRNFIRKWGTMVEHDSFMKPIVSPKYNVGFNLTDDCPMDILMAIEPYCDILFAPNQEVIDMYIKEEQELTDYNLSEKLNPESFNPGVEVIFNPKSMSQYSWSLLQQLPKIIQDSGEEGETFELDIFEIKIKSMKTYEKELISAI
jgi:glycosyltransferase involved in cell wall biosynthesis